MLQGERIRLRTVRERDLDELFRKLNDLDYRGRYYPLGVQSEPAFRKAFHDGGFWTPDEGMLLLVDASDTIVGQIEFFPITSYLTGFELSYLLFGDDHAGKGYTTEAVGLLSRYLFGRLRIDRVQLNIHPDNHASRRVAEKSGFTFEGVMRGCWFHEGQFHDLEIWSMLRSELPAP